MYAVIETGGKQYKVEPGDVIEIERLNDAPGEPIEFDRVLFYSSDDDVRTGTPVLEGARVIGSVVDHTLDAKKMSATYKRRTGYRRKKGHRQKLTRVAISKIAVG
ncbi:MAG: 50S ribosomal protein L21 [Candidatus Brocadiae bacterium]|nr:50S ribosomal protein L21 [Candidatus Brocadiia bacterium]